MLRLLSLADLAAGDDEDVRVLLGAARLLTLARGLAPHGLCAAQTATLAALAAAVRVINRVLRGAAYGR